MENMPQLKNNNANFNGVEFDPIYKFYFYG